MLRYDLIIVGGGLVGAGLALALRHTDLRIALIDAKLPSSDDPRLFALNSTSCQFLENLAIWPQLNEFAAPIHQVHVSNQGRFGNVRLLREEANLPALGYVIPAKHIEATLNDELQKLPNCTIYRPAKLQTLRQENGVAQLTIATAAGEKLLAAPIVIGADGTESTVRTQLNIKADIFDYEQTAIVTRTELQRSHQNIAYERFTATGAIAMLPLIGAECATIWTADKSTVAALMAMSDTEFLQALQQGFGYRLGRLQNITQRHMFPLRMVRAEKSLDQCVFLIGNSAHTLPPIAAQGFNLAIYELAVLAEGIIEKTQQQQTFTAADLQAICEKTLKQQATSIGVSHRLSRLFATDSAWLSMATQVGMLGLNLAAPLKKRFLDGIMGRSGRVPRLLLSKQP